MPDMTAIDADVIIVGAGPAGLMLAGELCLAGVRPLVLERQPRLLQPPKASAFNGQIVELLRYRGLLDRVEAASGRPVGPAPGAPFGGLQLDFSHLADPPVRVARLPQPQLERLLSERAGELGASIRHGHEVAGVSQDAAAVTADVRGPDGPYRTTARYLVGCDGAHSKVRATAGIAFPGTTYPEVNRLAEVTVPDSVTRLANGDLDVPGLGRIRAGFTRTDRGVFGFGPLAPGTLLIQTTEEEPAPDGDDAPMTLGELQDSIRRVLGADLPLGDVTRLSRYGFQARLAERYRDGRILLAGDAAHQFPATGIGVNFGMLDAVNLAWKLAAAVGGWASAGLLDTYHRERHFAGERALLQTQARVALRRGGTRPRMPSGSSSPSSSPTSSHCAASARSSPVPASATRCQVPARTPWPAPSRPTSPCTPARAPPASRNSCAPRGPSSSTSPTARTCAGWPWTGGTASTSAPPRPIARQPTPCSSARTPASPGPRPPVSRPVPPRPHCGKRSGTGSAHPAPPESAL
jgi:2-polyprenyl-6-methoxyphenol hydroxylase-like FAD-dependent oxidoreductase